MNLHPKVSAALCWVVAATCLGCSSRAGGRAEGNRSVHLASPSASGDRNAVRSVDIVSGSAVLSGSVVPAGDYPVREALLSSHDELLLVGGPDGERWVQSDAVFTSRERALLRGLDAGAVHVQFFTSGDDAVVLTPDRVFVVRFSTARVRLLDRVGAVLEGCRMNATLDEYECSLDMGWGANALFDSEGHRVSGDFEPLWNRPGG